MPSPDNYFQAIVHQTGGKKSYKYEVSGKDVNDTIAKGIAEIGSLNEPVMQNIINDMNTFAKNILQAARSHDRGSLKHSCKNYAILLAQRLQEKHVFQVEFDVNEDKKIILKEVDTTSDKYKGAIYGGLHVLQKAKQRYSNLYPNGAQTPQNSQNQNTAPVNSNVVNNTNNTPTQSNNNSNVGNNTNNTNTQQNQSGATQTNGNTASTSHIPGKDTLDNTSIIKALLDDLKAGLIKNTSQKMQEQQTNQRALKDIQDSSDFENELNKKQRDGVIALMRLLSDANSIFIDNKGEFAKSVKQSLDLMNQGNAELSIIANQNGEFQDDVDMSYVI